MPTMAGIVREGVGEVGLAEVAAEVGAWGGGSSGNSKARRKSVGSGRVLREEGELQQQEKV